MANSEDGAGRDLEQLNSRLLRVLLRLDLVYSPLFLDEEERLINSLLAVLRDLLDHPWVHRRHNADDVASSVCYDLMFAWRGAMPLWFTRTYLWTLLRRHLGQERPPRAEKDLDFEIIPAREHDTAIFAEEVAQLQQVGTSFRSRLDSAHRNLFDAWVRDAGEPGWKKAFADETHVSPTWVTNHLNRLREDLRNWHGITDPDQFVQALQFFTPPSDDGEVEGETEAHEEQHEDGPHEVPPRVELIEVFGEDLLLQHFRRACADPACLSDEHVLEVVLAEANVQLAFEQILERARNRYICWVREVGRQRLSAWKYYRRLTTGRVNVENILSRDRDIWTDAQCQLARRLAVSARPGGKQGAAELPISFQDLPLRLGVDRRSIDELLLRLRDSAGRREPRSRRNPDRPYAGG
jgi:hypothetical protein